MTTFTVDVDIKQIGLPDKLESNSVHLISGYHCSTSCLDFTRTLIYNEENPIGCLC